MTILHTLKKRGPASLVAATLQAALDRLSADPSRYPAALLFGPAQYPPSDQD